MKKNIFKVVAFIFAALMVTGCVDYEVSMGVNEDKSMDFKYHMAMDMSSFAGMGGEDTTSTGDTGLGDAGMDEEQINSLKEKGYTVDVKNEDYKYDLTISKKFDSIDKVSSTEDVVVDMTKFGENDFKEVFFKKSQNGKKDVYSANIVFSDNESSAEYGEYSSMFNLKYEVTLPVKPTTHNATSVSEDGKTLTWKLDLTMKNDIKYTFELENKDAKTSVNDSADSFFTNASTMTYVIIGGLSLLVVALIIVVIVLVVSSKKKKSVNDNVNM